VDSLPLFAAGSKPDRMEPGNRG